MCVTVVIRRGIGADLVEKLSEIKCTVKGICVKFFELKMAFQLLCQALCARAHAHVHTCMRVLMCMFVVNSCCFL
jgi:hypothetical protein